jgi:hypothetical protein
MSITIVASFAQPAVPGASAAGGATDPLAVDDASIGLDFASMLLTLPVVNAAPLPPGSSRQPGPGDQATLPEAEFGQKLLWFAGNEKQFAQLTVHPPQLGSIEITLNIDKNGANAHFVSASAEVRGAIETALPRLREMFTANGMDLGQVSVGSESFQQQSGGQQEPSRRPRLLSDNGILRVDSAGGLPNHAAAARGGHGLIDTFA